MSSLSALHGRFADGLTLLRLMCAGPLALCVLNDLWAGAAIILGAAVASDWADGRLARRGPPSSYGGVFDHGADACFVVAGLGALAAQGWIVSWLPLLIALAFVQYVLDSSAHHGAPLRGNRLGRSNGIAYYVLVAGAVGREVLPLPWLSPTWIKVASAALCLTTLVSMTQRAARSSAPSRRARDSRGARRGGRSRH